MSGIVLHTIHDVTVILVGQHVTSHRSARYQPIRWTRWLCHAVSLSQSANRFSHTALNGAILSSKTSYGQLLSATDIRRCSVFGMLASTNPVSPCCFPLPHISFLWRNVSPKHFGAVLPNMLQVVVRISNSFHRPSSSVLFASRRSSCAPMR